jgi:hypothetical protein
MSLMSVTQQFRKVVLTEFQQFCENAGFGDTEMLAQMCAEYLKTPPSAKESPREEPVKVKKGRGKKKAPEESCDFCRMPEPNTEKCLARSFAKGLGYQCTRKHSDGDYCKMHAKQFVEHDEPAFGRIDQPRTLMKHDGNGECGWKHFNDSGNGTENVDQETVGVGTTPTVVESQAPVVEEHQETNESVVEEPLVITEPVAEEQPVVETRTTTAPAEVVVENVLEGIVNAVVEENQAVVEEEEKPAVVEENQAVVEDEKPAVVEEEKPVVVKEEPAVVKEEPAVVKEDKKSVVVEKEPTVVEAVIGDNGSVTEDMTDEEEDLDVDLDANPTVAPVIKEGKYKGMKFQFVFGEEVIIQKVSKKHGVTHCGTMDPDDEDVMFTEEYQMAFDTMVDEEFEDDDKIYWIE